MGFCLRAVAILMVVAFALPVVVGQPPGSGAPSQPIPGGPAAPQPAKRQLTVKVFKLERGDPEVVIRALGSLLENPDAEVAPQMPPGGAPGVAAPAGPGGPMPGGFGSSPGGVGGIGGVGGSGFGGIGGSFGIGGVGPPGGFGGIGGSLGIGGVPPGGFGGGPPAGGMLGVVGQPGGGVIGCFIGGGGNNLTPVWRATVQPRTRAVVVRGSDRHIKVAADLVAILDRPADAPLPKLQVVKAFALKHATAEELEEVIEALSFDDLKVAGLDERLLALVAPDDVSRSVAQLVTELDVPGNGDPAPKPKPAPDKGGKPNESKLPK